MYFIDTDDDYFIPKLYDHENILSCLDCSVHIENGFIQEILCDNFIITIGSYVNKNDVKKFYGRKFLLNDIETIKIFAPLSNTESIESLLFWCVKNSRLDYIQIIYDLGINIDVKYHKKINIIDVAVGQNNYEIVKYLIDIGCQYKNGLKFLSFPYIIDKNIIELLVENKNYDIEYIKYLVEHIIYFGYDVNIICVLVELGYDINSMNYGALLYCTTNISVDKLKQLFNHVNIKNLSQNKEKCRDIFLNVCNYCCLDAVKFMEELGLISELHPDYNYEILKRSMHNKNESVEIFNYLISIGYFYKNFFSNFMTICAIPLNKNMINRLIELGLELGIDILKNGDTYHALIYSIQSVNKYITGYLIEIGVKFDYEELYKLVIKNNDYDLINLLAERGADINFCIKYAVSIGNFKMAKFLKNLGAEYNDTEYAMREIIDQLLKKITNLINVDKFEYMDSKVLIDTWIDKGMCQDYWIMD
ncbi:hypothetical protein QLL95_gp0733 [Cotonvirus japonicus]|uniref:Ankyrin repeat protein n=1 Tax=Cotonvirus japonicus TaxID=2811091 RepID=A0ABM7NT89_9VIRU|nr:hypothetical protein QLL95_gp0733 [Cotonvirus japonicus]BCS83390.1 hypothetical protein [Cotonvirus japonicus]